MSLNSENTAALKIKRIFQKNALAWNIALKFFIGISLISLIVLIYPSGESMEYNYLIGSVWTEKDLVAPFSFPVYKDHFEYEKEKNEAARSVYFVFDHCDPCELSAFIDLDSLINIIKSASALANINDKILTPGKKDSAKRVFPDIKSAFTDREWNVLSIWRKGENKSYSQKLNNLKLILSRLLEDILKPGIVDDAKIKNSHNFIAVRKGIQEEIVRSEKIYNFEEAIAELDNQLQSALVDEDAFLIAKKIVSMVLQPNLLYNAGQTNLAINIAQDDVPRTIGFVQENERIISKHDRVTEELKLKLDSYLKAKADRSSSYDLLLQRLGISLHVILIIGLYTTYLYLFRKKIFKNNTMLGLIAILFAMEIFLTFLSLEISTSLPIQYLILIPAASMLLTIIFDSRVAFYGTVTMAFLIAGIRGNDYSIAFASLVAGSFGVYTVRDIKNRTQIFRSLIFIFIGYSIVIIAMVMERYESFNTILIELTFVLANAVFSAVLTYGLLIFFERVFNITTDLKLVELSDINNPLLQQLSEKAPGTFHHSVILGNLAEAAAEAISANSILARVGAYYHDIGKIPKPEYFVENQVGNLNRHTRLRPRMSALILISHVKEGIEFGRENKLPPVIIDFIPQHHGTARISFFFDKALKQAAARKNPKDTVQEDDFRYPGPKPQTKETGIVMLADSIEATARATADLTPQKLESVIDGMIKQRLIEGQLDECELTLRDLSKIKEAFFKILVGIHHHRIVYPEKKEPPEEVIDQTGAGQISVTQETVQALIPETKSEQPAGPPPTQSEPPANTQ